MEPVKKIQDLMEVVERLLKDYPHLRDDDRRLLANIWSMQLGGTQNLQKISMLDFLNLYVGCQKLSTPDSVSRARRKVQELNPSVRGKNYVERKKMEQNTRTKIKALSV